MTKSAGMPEAPSAIDTEEIASVLSHYDIGEIRSIRVYPRGSRKAPKALVEAGIGSLILKRRGPGRDDPRRIVFEHAVHERLSESGYPVVEIIRSARSRSTVVRAGSGIYELFRYVKASRCDGSREALESCGRGLAMLHDTLRDFKHRPPGVHGFHAVPDLAGHLERYAETLRSSTRQACDDLMLGYQLASAEVDALGWSDWPCTIVHGDWHPGNVLFGPDGHLAAVLDFDAARREPRVSDLAAAVLHFGRYVNSKRQGDESIWPVDLDLEAAGWLVGGYAKAAADPLRGTELAAIPALIVEAVVLETMPPMIRDGHFGPHESKSFLPMVVKSIREIQRQSGRLIASMRAMVE
ncbi:MAG: phosphotransferase [Phycisphaerales bacterium]|nr:phosphotransferase [Phycisphaerales bacterium]